MLDQGQPEGDNPRVKAGYTFLGQFIDHDLTLDITSVLEQEVDLAAVENFRTPALELDSLYGMGPALQPYLYDQENPAKLLIGDANTDLPRNRQGRALIGDPRNDENLIISQLHLLFLKFHNRVVDHLVATGSQSDLFTTAQRLVRWHYQWIVVNEFLPRIAGPSAGRRVAALAAAAGRAFLPVEFTVAAYRFGHSQVRNGYRVNAQFAAALFPQPGTPPGARDLRGFRPIAPENAVDWDFFFGVSANSQAGRRIDATLVANLLRLPDGVVPANTPDAFRSLATRNLQRGLDFGLPSGQNVAAALSLPDRLPDASVWPDGSGGEGQAPLWYYILREAGVLADGKHLAGVGAEIVTSTFADILRSDRASFLQQQPDWKPTLPSTRPDTFTMTDLVNFTLGTNLVGEDTAALP